jgi:tetratricopeptide (TPR) repeat protein
MSSEIEKAALQHCDAGLRHMWNFEVELAIEAFDRALDLAQSEEVIELVTIRKAEALIAADRDGPEVGALPGIVMRRRSPRHTYMAASALMRRLVERGNCRRAIFYGEVAREAAAELGDPFATAGLLNAFGNAYVVDSRFAEAIVVFQEALSALALVDPENGDAATLRSGVLANLGGAKILSDHFEEGIRLSESVVPDLTDSYDRAEVFLDLCYGHLSLKEYDLAERFGLAALELSSIDRHVRNANFFLGEICFRTGRSEEAGRYFDVVAAFYPNFRNMKHVLLGVDLCAVVNWKL